MLKNLSKFKLYNFSRSFIALYPPKAGNKVVSSMD